MAIEAHSTFFQFYFRRTARIQLHPGQPMRRILLIVTALLAVSGLLLTFYAPLDFDLAWRKWLSLIHIWGGVFFLVVFALYAWDHISANRHWLRIPALVTFSGTVQTCAAVLIVLTGIVLMLYGNVAWPTLRTLHHWLTYLLAASLLLHRYSRKG